MISEIPSECQTVWIQIRPDSLSGLIWFQTVYKVYQYEMTSVGKELNATGGNMRVVPLSSGSSQAILFHSFTIH